MLEDREQQLQFIFTGERISEYFTAPNPFGPAPGQATPLVTAEAFR